MLTCETATKSNAIILLAHLDESIVEFMQYYHARIQEFSTGGPGQSDIKSPDVFFLFFFSLSAYFREVKWSISEKYIIFQGSRGGPTFSRGGPTFSRGGGGV